MRGRILSIVLILTLIIAGIPRTVLAQTKMTETSVEYVFGEQISFQAIIQSDQPIELAITFFQAHNESRTNIGLATVDSVNKTTYKLTYTHQISDYTLRAFSQIDYWFEIRLEGGDVYRTPITEFSYIDNRFEWRTLQEGKFQVNWYSDQDIVFAQSVLDVTQEGLKRIQSILSVPAPGPLAIYVYDDAKAMQDTLNPGSPSWVAGHADPDLGVVVVNIPPGPEQQTLIEGRIPHELMHIMLYQATGRGYKHLPTWLNEGLASMAELYPNPDYRILIENAVEHGGLLPMSSLCRSFPRDASNALLSYAQAASFTEFIHSTYGISSMDDLVAAYANGVDCEIGAEIALGAGLSQLERQWRRDTLDDSIIRKALYNMIPWLLLLAVLLGGLLGPVILKSRSNPSH